jgi:hypothetical protein
LGYNTTTVNGRKVRGQSRQLNDQDLVAIGNEPLFQVKLLTAVSDNGLDTEHASETPPRPRLTRRRKLWIGIGLYLLLMLGLIVFLFTLTWGGAVVGAAPRLTVDQIVRSIRQPLPPKDAYPAQMQNWLEQARTLHERLDAMPDKLFDAYRAFQHAVAFAPGHRLAEGRDLLNFEYTRERLIETIRGLYDDAYRKLRSHQYEEAYSAFEKVMQSYPATDSIVYRNARHHQNAASQRMKQSARRRRRGLF